MEARGKIKAIGKLLIVAILRMKRFYKYCAEGVWNESGQSKSVNFIKVVNLSVRSFMDSNLQMRACALTYRTLLAIVPVLAMIFAIGRGFGFQNLLEGDLMRAFPSQREAVSEVLTFVDSYLARTSEGVFVGVGVLFLLWTLISLLSHVEATFNQIWGIKKGRSLYRKITDYTAICLFLPVLLVCSSGISIFMSNAVQTMLPYRFVSPIATGLLDFAPYVLTWIFFIAAYYLVPNTKVRFRNTVLAGIVCGTGIQVVQWLIVSGQVYVSSYNAIYGSFAFVPLLLIWIQLSWLICLSGVVVTYSTQNVVSYNFHSNIKDISREYYDEVSIIVLAVIVKRFVNAERAYSAEELSARYGIPMRLNVEIIERLQECGFISEVIIRNEGVGYQPAFDIEQMSVNSVCEALGKMGKSNFVPAFDGECAEALELLQGARKNGRGLSSDMLIKDVPVRLR